MNAFLFDFGGTLDTNGVHWSEKFWDAYQELKLGVEKQDFERAYVAAESRMLPGVMNPGESLLATLQKQVSFQFDALRAGGHADHQRSLAAAPARVAAVCYESVQTTLRSVRPLLAACHRKHSIAIVSNFYGNLRAVCRDLNIEEHCDTIVDSAIVGVRKPDPEIFRLALAELGVAPHDALVIGDSYERDIVPAKTIGCSTIWLRGRSWREPSATPSADFVIHSITDVSSFLKSVKQLTTLA
jgi:HAD superfamily hydrolase (TIGR01509 family)